MLCTPRFRRAVALGRGIGESEVDAPARALMGGLPYPHATQMLVCGVVVLPLDHLGLNGGHRDE